MFFVGEGQPNQWLPVSQNIISHHKFALTKVQSKTHKIPLICLGKALKENRPTIVIQVVALSFHLSPLPILLLTS